MTESLNTREIAADAVTAILEEGRFTHTVLRQVLDKYAFLSESERHFLARLIRGTVESCIRLDWYLDQISSTPVRKQKPFIRTLLRITAYQILEMDQIPDRAACSEAVKLAKKRGFTGLSGFVNGVSRNLSRQKESMVLPEDWSVKYSVPQWIIAKYNRAASAERTKNSLEFLQKGEGGRMTVHLHLSKASREEIISRMEEDGIQIQDDPYFTDVLHISAPDGLSMSSAFADGLFQVQDISSILACKAADIKPGMKAVDICAAPGGKSIFLAEKMAGTGSVVSRDLTPEKVELITENAERAGLTNLHPQVFDAASSDPENKGAFDLVFADVPCSGLGILARKPDIRYNQSPEGTDELVKIQRSILERAVELLAPGAVLLFSTCTVNTQENQDNFRLLADEYGLEPQDITQVLPGLPLPETAKEGYVQLLPGELGGDGFFFARLKKKV